MNNIGPLVYLAHIITFCWLHYRMNLANSLSHLHLICDTGGFTCDIWGSYSSVAAYSSGTWHCVMGEWFSTIWRHTVTSLSSVKWSHEDESSVLLSKVSNHSPSVTVWHCRRPESSGCYVSIVMKSVNWSSACFPTMFVLNTNPTRSVSINSEERRDHALSLFSSESWF